MIDVQLVGGMAGPSEGGKGLIYSKWRSVNKDGRSEGGMRSPEGEGTLGPRFPVYGIQLKFPGEISVSESLATIGWAPMDGGVLNKSQLKLSEENPHSGKTVVVQNWMQGTKEVSSHAVINQQQPLFNKEPVTTVTLYPLYVFDVNSINDRLRTYEESHDIEPGNVERFQTITEFIKDHPDLANSG